MKLWFPEFAKLPIGVVDPLLGSNHQHFALWMGLEILLISMLIVVAFPLGTYAIIVWPSEVRAATDRLFPEP